MKLGFSVFVEFGHTNYFTNDGKHVNSPLPFNPWKYEKKEDLLKATQNKRVSESGNWGGLLGTVKNFSWEINTDGSYDCKIIEDFDVEVYLNKEIDQLKKSQEIKNKI